jgi:hypothetical protein
MVMQLGRGLSAIGNSYAGTITRSTTQIRRGTALGKRRAGRAEIFALPVVARI